MVKYKNQQIELDRLLSYVLESGASDLHLLVGKPPIVRIDSELVSIKDYSSYDQEDLEKLISALLDDSTKARLEEQRQVDFSYNLRNSARFSVNVYYQKGTMAAALRYIPSKIQTLEELNMPAQIGNFIKFRQGLVLIVGPNGHGKSTTMAAIVDMINHKRSGHIITIEDPIEYIFTPDKSIISQREVYQDAKSFVQAIRSTVREDVDVVMVGEMRDLESVSAAITVAETGHLVLATLHTNDAPQTIDRIIDIFPSHQQNQIRSQLANMLLGVVSQRLLPRIGGGRLPAVEIMMTNNAVKNLIREGKTYELYNVIHSGSAAGMISLDSSLANMVKQGLVKLEVAEGYSNSPEVFKSLVKRF